MTVLDDRTDIIIWLDDNIDDSLMDDYIDMDMDILSDGKISEYAMTIREELLVSLGAAGSQDR
jgi:hypothetical protein